MPTLLCKNGFRFFFFSNEGTEPPHVHVQRGHRVAKFWLEPLQLEKSGGMAGHELTKSLTILKEHREEFLEKWHEYFSSEA